MGSGSVRLARGLVAVVTWGTLLVAAKPASADAGGYPYRSAANCAAQFGAGNWCVDENRNGSFSSGEQWSPYGFVYRNCTDFVAWKINSLGVRFSNGLGGGRFGNASNWASNARSLGWTVSTTPRVRSIGVRDSGHVVFVDSVNGDGSVNYSQYNARYDGNPSTGSGRLDRYIYVPGLTVAPPSSPPPSSPPPSSPSPAQYANSLVRWDRDSVTTWFVTPDLRRLWVPDGGTFNELKARGFGGPHSLSSSTLDQMPDMTHHWVASGASWGANRTMRRGMTVRSSDGRFTLAMQGDGNLVLYGPTGRALWATSFRTGSWGAQEYVVFQGDGNLVTYGGGRAIWASNTAGSGANQFVVQSDGNLVIYRNSTPVWASNTAGQT